MTVLADLRSLDDPGLLDAYRAADDTVARAVLAEAGRRDASDRLARAREVLAKVRAEGEQAAYAQYLQASDYTRGRLLSPAGMAAGIAEQALWRMPEAQLARYASEELRDFFLFTTPRITPGGYVKQHAAQARIARAEALDTTTETTATTHDGSTTDDQRDATAGLADDAAGDVRPEQAAEEVPGCPRGPVSRDRRASASGDAEGASGDGAGRPGGPADPAGRRAMSDAERIASYLAYGREQAGEYMMWAREDVAKATGTVPRLAPSYADHAMRPLRRIDLWENRLPFGDVCLWYGDGAVGKGRAITDLAARVTTGRAMPLCTDTDEPGSVILIQPEDDPNEEVAYRLRASGADLTRCYDLTRLPSGARFKLSADGKTEGHVNQLRALIDELEQAGRNPRLVVVDPLAAVVGSGSIQTNSGARNLIEPLQDLAKATGVCILVVAHTVASGKLQGSAGLQQAVRLVFKVTRDRENPAYRVLALVKGNNVGNLDDLKYTITSGETGGVRVVWQDREQITAQRQAWRDRLAARRTAAA